MRDSIIKISDMLNYAVELGHSVVAITDHESISGSIKAQQYYKKIKEKTPNFKMILGNEIYLVRNGLTKENYVSGVDKYWHFILLAKDIEGHKQIREISTRAWMRSWMQGKMRRVPTYYQDLIDIIDKNKGHVIGSTACLGSYVAELIRNKQYDKLENWLSQMVRLFGKGNFYIELQPPAELGNEQDIVNRKLVEFSFKLGIPYIVTTDSHYAKKDDAKIHKAYLNSQDGEREVDEFYATTYMMSTEELESYFKGTNIDLQIAYKNIQTIAEMCEDYDLCRPLKIPQLSWKSFNPASKIEDWYSRIPLLETFYNSDYKGDKELVKAIVERFEKEPKLQYQEVYDSINECLSMTWESSLVNKTHWSAYFLNLQKVIDYCWEAGSLVGPGRGSGVGFSLLYFLDIIQIMPLWETTKTYAWRFLNPSRVSVLDIDVDIEGGKRGDVLSYLREKYGQDRVSNVITFGTEKSKSAILTAARGLGIDVDAAQYIASLIPSDRGATRTLAETYYGDKEKGFDPVRLFVEEMNSNPELWEVAKKIEGLVCRIGSHAGGVIFVDEPFTESTALKRTPDDIIVTAYDLHDCESVSLIKMDLLSVEALDKIHVCLDLLAKNKLIEKKETLKETYESVIGVYKLERTEPDMWKMIHQHKILSLFQMEKQSGVQGIALIHPVTVDELAVLNSVIRLMASEKGAEQPLNMWARYRKDINQWYKEMQNFGLSDEEIDWLSHHSAITDGICETQEGLMSLVQEPRLGGNSLSFADKCRKGLAKKIGSLFNECEREFYNNVKEKKCSERLAHYVWDVLLKVQRGYSFNRSHCLAYSLIALQEMNLAYHFPIIYWNTACLIVDSGGEDGNTDYTKMAQSVNLTRQAGINISLIDINLSASGFEPDEKNNRIMFGLKALTNINDDTVEKIKQNRPYVSLIDFYYRANPGHQAMIALIKGGAFDQFCSRMEAMVQYLWITCDKKNKLTLQNIPGLIKYKLVPNTTDGIIARRVFEFNRYLKAECKHPIDNTKYILSDRAIDFINEIGEEKSCSFKESYILLDVKEWDKIYQRYMNIFRKWLSENKNILNELNTKIFMDDWIKYAKKGNISAWEMEALCFYYHEHELSNVDNKKYGLTDFFSLPEEPIVDKIYRKNIPIFKLFKICGTCIAKDKNKHTVHLLTTTGVVTVKFTKDFFASFDRQISSVGENGKKTVIEKSWFNRGKMIIVTGIRRGDEFVCKKYKSSPGHHLYQIESVNEDGTLVLNSERASEKE